MENAEKLRLIEAFYRGTLTGEDNATFSKLMNDDLSFKHEVQDYKSIFIGFEALHVEEFQKNLMNFEAKHSAQEKQSSEELSQQSRSAVIRPLKKFYYAAAAIALFVCATFGYNQWATSTFDEYFQASQFAKSSLAFQMKDTRGSEVFTEEDKIKKNAFSAYRNREFNQAISLLEGYIKEYKEIASKDYQSILVLELLLFCSLPIEKLLIPKSIDNLQMHFLYIP
jgi:hypothetical protein